MADAATTSSRGGSVATTTKGEQTRSRILDTALNLFREHGYEATTMRAVAGRAGVSLGNSYYYFPSKETLIQAYYAQIHDQHRAACRPILDAERDLRKRLLGVVRAQIAVAEPYHRFAAVLFRTAADPRSPLNPFSAESRPIRDESTAIFREVLEGSTARIPRDLVDDLPTLLWTYHMGIVLFWIHDESPDRERTKRLVDESVHVIVRLIALAQLPILRATRRRLLRLVSDVSGGGS
jgi:AcrR family transcriptional regulator